MKDYRKMLFVFNPKSGKAQIGNYLLNITQTFTWGGFYVTVYPTKERLDGYRTIRDTADGFDLVVCSGGDGTLNESVRGLMDSKTPEGKRRLGYIPTGTVNDFANSLGLSKDMLKAAETVMTGAGFATDIGGFNDTFFTYVAAFGAFTDVAYETPQNKKNMLGHLAYVLEGFKRLSSIKGHHMHLKFKGSQGEGEMEGDYAFGMVSNSMSVGGHRTRDDLGIVLDDGEFEVALLHMPSYKLAELQNTINALLRRDFRSAKGVEFFRASEITFISSEPVAWTIDGEYGGSLERAVIKNHPRAIVFLKDPSPEENALEMEQLALETLALEERQGEAEPTENTSE